MYLSQTEENYLKCIYKLSEHGANAVNTNAVSAAINTTAASVTDMLKRLSEKGLADYVRYKGVRLTDQGLLMARNLVRRHRLWEVFLAEKLHISWDEVHDIAEQLEHIQSPLLMQRLDEFLGFPRVDPHGDPIPDPMGNYEHREEVLLSDIAKGQSCVIVGVKEDSADFLQYLSQNRLLLGTKLILLDKAAFDNSVVVQLPDMERRGLSFQIACNLLVNPLA